MELREYQKEVLEIIDNLEKGSYLVQMATGLGKTATFTNIKRKGRVLVLAHRAELVTQPIKYYDVKVGIEMGKHKSNGEEVVIASVQSLIHRLDKFEKDAFDIIITDECHHSAARSYKKIYNYFNPRLHIGFTATPNRGDGVRLDDVFDGIIYEKDIKWAIENKYLCDINCLRVDIGYDISDVSMRMGDFSVGELVEKMDIEKTNLAIAEAYREYAKGQTLIFGASVRHCENIANEIEGAVAVTANTKDREEIIRRFTNKEIKVLVNCMIFTEGTDMPLVETVMMARPTTNSSLYTQMVGRGLRLHPDKDKLTLIDLVGVTGKNDICTAPTLLGFDLNNVPNERRDKIVGNLMDLPNIINEEEDCPESWIRNATNIDVWAENQDYNLHNINWFKLSNGDLIISLKRKRITLPCQDELGYTVYNEEKMKMQEAIDAVFYDLNLNYQNERYIWDLSQSQRWYDDPISYKQVALIKRMLKGYNPSKLTKGQGALVLNKLLADRCS